ncbi:MAG: MFS transporter [candidate division KSB1 bacterium]|nr:MFS transporter [candidate division KSB1 bacterium]MDZ7319895.1 MFS transporter [candidate division KSB1 bacterium]MDZ7341143.1 MFS transporter [candidate division KSB1 bacterium]
MKEPTKLLNKNFFLLWQGQAVSKLGSQVFSIAMILWIIDVTGSATIMSLVMMMSSIPALILGPIGGAFADRHSRRLIIVFSDVLNGIAMLSFAAIVYFFPGQTKLNIIWLFLVSIWVAVVNSFFFPAISASIPEIVPKKKLTGANTLSQLSLQISVLVGQGLGGVFYKMLGGPLIFLLNGISYLFSATSESFISIPQQIAKNEGNWKEQFRHFKTDIVEGLRYIWQKAGLRELLIISAIMNFFITPVILLFPFYVEKFLNLGDDWQKWFGFLIATYGVGTMLGYVSASVTNFAGKIRGRLMIIFIVLESSIYAMLGLAGGPIVVMIMALIAGMLNGYTGVNIMTILQFTTPSAIRGRVFGLLGTLVGIISPIAMGLSGAIADLLNQNIPLIYEICGISLASLSILIALNKNYRNYLMLEPEDEMIVEKEKLSVEVPAAL